MNNMNLMFTKLKMPQPRKKYIIRKDIFLKLDKLEEYKVILIKGGAGSGKTTLITSFVKEKAISNLKWISLDENCNDVFMFWSYFIEAVKDYLGGSQHGLTAIYDANFQKSNFESLLTLLINALDTEEDIFIVLDDFHHITDKFLIDTMDFFLKNVSYNIHIILLTREEPLIYLGGINMEGRLLEINDNDLKLQKEEGICFLKDTLELNLGNDTLNFISDLAEGWIGGMQLVAAASRGKSENEIRSLKLDNKIVGEYLTKEVFDVLNEEEKNFLVTTSILSYFNEEICSKLLENIDFKKMMAALEQRNLLIVSIDDENSIYRYHNILGEYLKLRFEELDKETRIRWHLKAADIFKELGDLDEYLNQLFSAKDYLQAMQVIVGFPQNATTFSYMTKVPESYIYKNRDFAYQRFFYHYANMELEKCRSIYKLIKNNMNNDPTFDAFKYSYMFVEDTFRVNKVKTMSVDEINKLPLNKVTKAFVFIKDASFLYAQNRYDEAMNFANKALIYSKNIVNPYITFFALGVKAQTLEEQGSFNLCLDIYKEMYKIITDGNAPSMFANTFYISIVGVYLKQMNIQAAYKSLKTVKECIGDKILSVDRGYRYNIAEYKFITGDIKEAAQIVFELTMVETYKNTVYIAQLLKYIFKYGELNEGLLERFISDYESTAIAQRSLESQLLYNRILFSSGKCAEAMKNVDEILKYSRKNEIKLKIAEAALFKIHMLISDKEDKRQIVNLFKEAVFYSFQDRIMLPFYFENETVEKVLKKYEAEIQFGIANSNEKIYIEDIKKICGINSEIKNILTDREVEVLKQLSTGISNKEIAENLCISLATVKSHIINIYSKLQVNSRIAAVEAGKRRGIL